MEEKLRNLSQNIANNTGHREAEEPDMRDEDRISDEELRDTPSDEGNERIDADYTEEVPAEPEEGDEEYHDEPSENTPEENEAPIDESQPEPEEAEEYHDSNDINEEAPADDGGEPVTINFNPVEEQEEIADYTPEEEPVETYDEAPEEPVDEQSELNEEVQPEEPQPAKAAILTMNEEHPEPENPSDRATKYSPEVEAALSRINSEDSSVDLSEPLSTEPRKKHHNIGRIFLFILFVVALAVGIICILVEQKIIDNPFPNLFKKETSEVQPADDTPKPVEKYLAIAEWGVKILKPEGVDGFWYETVADNENELRIFGTDEDHVADETAENEGANAVLSLIRSTNSTFAYSDTLTLSPITSISGHYYYLTFISGEMEDETVQLFTEKLLNNSQSILAL